MPSNLELRDLTPQLGSGRAQQCDDAAVMISAAPFIMRNVSGLARDQRAARDQRFGGADHARSIDIEALAMRNASVDETMTSSD